MYLHNYNTKRTSLSQTGNYDAKVLWNDEYRRIKFSSDTKWEIFLSNISKMTSIKSDNLKLYYLDNENDWIRFSDVSEWEDLKSFLKEDGVLQIKVKVQAKQEKESSSINSISNSISSSTSNSKLFQNPSSSISNDRTDATEVSSLSIYTSQQKKRLSDSIGLDLPHPSSILDSQPYNNNLDEIAPPSYKNIDNQFNISEKDLKELQSKIDKNVEFIKNDLGYDDEAKIRMLLVKHNGCVSEVVKEMNYYLTK